jgi:hypothetical protein
VFSAWWQEAREVEYQGAFAAHIDAIVAQMGRS